MSENTVLGHYNFTPDQVIKDLACFLDDCGIDATEAYKKMNIYET